MNVVDVTEAQMKEQLEVLIDPLVEDNLDLVIGAALEAMKLQGIHFKRGGYTGYNISSNGLWK